MITADLGPHTSPVIFRSPPPPSLPSKWKELPSLSLAIWHALPVREFDTTPPRFPSTHRVHHEISACQISPFRKHNAPVIIFVLPHKISLVTELSFNVVMDNWYQQERLPRNKDRMQATRNTARKPLIVLSASGNMSQEPSRCSSARAMPHKLHVRRR